MTTASTATAVRLRPGHSSRIWLWGTLAAAAVAMSPIAAIIWLALEPAAPGAWAHLAGTVLPGYLRRTGLLLAGIGVCVLIVGTGTAWLVTMCRFPGYRIFRWTMLLPLAAPTYIIAYVYVDLLEYAGVVQSGLRDAMGWHSPGDYWFPEIRSLPGAILVMSLVLYPYVFLTARAAFVSQPASMLDVSRTLGQTAWQTFRRTALPLARPVIWIGLVLALLEALNDIGAVEYFGVRTLTVGIYDVWLQRSDLPGAARIATAMLALVIALLWIERRGRRGRRFSPASALSRSLPAYRLSGLRAAAAFLACAIPVTLGFLIPAGILALHAAGATHRMDAGAFRSATLNSLMVAGMAAALTAAAGLFLAYGARQARSAHAPPGRRGSILQAAVNLASTGYAIPGAVLGIGVLIPLAALDNAVDAASLHLFGLSTGLVLTGGVFAIVFACLVRFLTLAYGTVNAGLSNITPAMEMAARSLGTSPFGTLRRVHAPLIRSSILTAVLLVFVDCMKELPATLILRPFNFDTLATHVYTLASLGLVEESAPAALTIVAAGLIPVILLNNAISSARPGRHGAPVRRYLPWFALRR